MSKNKRVEARNVSMYPEEWEAVDQAAHERGFVTGRGPNTSLMLRQIIREWQRPEPAATAVLESGKT